MANENVSPIQQVCIIKIVFPVGSDDEAIDVKKRIGEAMKDMPDAQINFNLISGRPPMPGT